MGEKKKVTPVYPDMRFLPVMRLVYIFIVQLDLVMRKNKPLLSIMR